jgi:hypothetical protein
MVMLEVPVEHPSLTVNVAEKSPALEKETVLCSHLLASLFVIMQFPRVTPALPSFGEMAQDALVIVNVLFHARGILNLKALEDVPSNSNIVFWYTLYVWLLDTYCTIDLSELRRRVMQAVGVGGQRATKFTGADACLPQRDSAHMLKV